jgi:hypothetical protein
MVRIYYHIYSIDGVESIIDEQLSLIEKHFDFPYILNIGISIADDNSPTDSIIKQLHTYNNINNIVKDSHQKGNEFVTLNLIEKDKETFLNSDYIFYFHTKGASNLKNKNKYLNAVNWRNLMQYFNIERYKVVFRVFDTMDFNTYGMALKNISNDIPQNRLYSGIPYYHGNFWWMTAEYAKTINIDSIDTSKRWEAEFQYIQKGINWKPYSEYNNGEPNYKINLRKEDYNSLI